MTQLTTITLGYGCCCLLTSQGGGQIELAARPSSTCSHHLEMGSWTSRQCPNGMIHELRSVMTGPDVVDDLHNSSSHLIVPR